MLNLLLLLLLLCFVTYSESTPISVTGGKGGNVTLACKCEGSVILVTLNSRSEHIPVCQNEECSGRVFKKGNCDIIFKDLRLNDAGKYFLDVYYHNETKLERQIRTYQLHIDDKISVKIGEELKLEVMLPDADKVEHQSRGSTEWMKVWRRSKGVQSERMRISDGNLIISHFTARDTGTYRVLDPDGKPLITVKVRVSKEKLDDTDEGKTDDTKYSYWIGLTVVLVLLALILTAAALHTCRHRGSSCGVARRGHNTEYRRPRSTEGLMTAKGPAEHE